ncbi:MAG: DNA polymerase I, partial [Saprospiraceae bacterium]|nr:DNA polymerase I [Saprospiraceae bacterium]
MSGKKLFLLDGNALVYRAHFAFIGRPLINSKGMNTSAITGFVRSLWDILSNQKPTHIAVSFDVSGDTFRHEWYPEYKANRDAQPEDITAAMPYIIEIIKGFNIPIVTLEGWEADDLIGTISKQAEKEGFTVYMVTPDKDFGQLVSENIFLFKPSRQGNGIDILGEKEILNQWDIKRIDQVIDMLGLQGDSVDNIPGIPGIGPKTASKLLGEYDTVEGLIAHADELKGKQKEQVETFADQALLSKKLATINIHAPVQFDADDYKLSPINRDRLGDVFKELEFRTLSQAILGETPPVAAGGQTDLFGNPVAGKIKGERKPKPTAPSIGEKNIKNTSHEYHIADSSEKRKALIQNLEKLSEICFDTETTAIDANDAELIGISFSDQAHHGYWVPLPDDFNADKEILFEFKAVFENPAIIKIGQNIKYDALILQWYDIQLQGTFKDTMIAHYLLEPEMNHSMNYLSESYLNYEPVKIETLIGKKGISQLTMRQADQNKVKEYAAEDADITFQLQKLL